MIYPVTLNLLCRVRSWHPHALKQSSITVKAEKMLLMTSGHQDLAHNFNDPVSLSARGLALSILVEKSCLSIKEEKKEF